MVLTSIYCQQARVIVHPDGHADQWHDTVIRMDSLYRDDIPDRFYVLHVVRRILVYRLGRIWAVCETLSVHGILQDGTSCRVTLNPPWSTHVYVVYGFVRCFIIWYFIVIYRQYFIQFWAIYLWDTSYLLQKRPPQPLDFFGAPSSLFESISFGVSDVSIGTPWAVPHSPQEPS